MGLFSVNTTGFAPVDTIKKTPHGRLISWMTDSDNKTNKNTTSNKSSYDKELAEHKRQISLQARKSFIQQEEYYDMKTGEFKYRDIKSKQEPVNEKSTWEKIKDWWNGDNKKADDPLKTTQVSKFENSEDFGPQ